MPEDTLAAAVLYQATLDYIRHPKHRTEILIDLRGDWLKYLCGEKAVQLADMLENNLDSVIENMKKEYEK